MLISLMLLFSMQVDDPNSFELNEDLQVTEVNSASDSEDEQDYDDEIQVDPSVVCTNQTSF